MKQKAAIFLIVFLLLALSITLHRLNELYKQGAVCSEELTLLQNKEQRLREIYNLLQFIAGQELDPDAVALIIDSLDLDITDTAIQPILKITEKIALKSTAGKVEHSRSLMTPKKLTSKKEEEDVSDGEEELFPQDDQEKGTLSKNRTGLGFLKIRFKGKEINYIGETEKGMAHGRGVGLWPSGGVYEGEWKANKRQGKGTYTWADGERYEGEYVEDLRTGFGIYYWKNGQRYEGFWKDDKRDSTGTVYSKNGKLKYSGIWQNDKLIKEN